MSWQQLVDTQLMRKWTEEGWVQDCLESAAILGRGDAGVWACNPTFKLLRYVLPMQEDSDPSSFTDVEVDECANLLSLVAQWKPPVSGIRISGLKYMSVGADPERGVLYLRKAGGGGCLHRTRRTIIFGSYSEELSTSGALVTRHSNQICNERVEKLASFLIGKGF